MRLINRYRNLSSKALNPPLLFIFGLCSLVQYSPALASERRVAWTVDHPVADLDRACQTNDVGSCDILGHKYFDGTGVAQNRAQAAIFWSKACNGGHANSCNNVGYLYESGKGVAQNRVRATALYKRACNGGNELGCKNLADLSPPAAIVQRPMTQKEKAAAEHEEYVRRRAECIRLRNSQSRTTIDGYGYCW